MATETKTKEISGKSTMQEILEAYPAAKETLFLRVAYNKLKFEVEPTDNNLPDRVLESCHETT